MIFYTIFIVCTQTVQYLWRGLTARKLRHDMCRQKKTLLFKLFLVSVQTEKITAHRKTSGGVATKFYLFSHFWWQMEQIDFYTMFSICADWKKKKNQDLYTIFSICTQNVTYLWC